VLAYHIVIPRAFSPKEKKGGGGGGGGGANTILKGKGLLFIVLGVKKE